MNFDIDRFFKDYRIRYSVSSSGYRNIQCVFCSDTGEHMGWSYTGYVTCWKCGSHQLHESIKRLLNVSGSQARKIIEEYDSIAVHSQVLSKVRAKSITLPGGELNKWHRRYLEKRGFDPDYLIQKYGLRGTGIRESWEGIDYSQRVIIPIHDRRGSVVSFQGRDITGTNEARYKGCPKEKSVVYYKDILYGAQFVSGDAVGVLEGVTDQWRMGDGFVCTFGTAVTDAQVRELSAYRRIVMIFDPEPEAQKLAAGIATKLAALGRAVEIVELDTGGRDPGELTAKEVEKLKLEINL